MKTKSFSLDSKTVKEKIMAAQSIYKDIELYSLVPDNFTAKNLINKALSRVRIDRDGSDIKEYILSIMIGIFTFIDQDLFLNKLLKVFALDQIRFTEQGEENIIILYFGSIPYKDGIPQIPESTFSTATILDIKFDLSKIFENIQTTQSDRKHAYWQNMLDDLSSDKDLSLPLKLQAVVDEGDREKLQEFMIKQPIKEQCFDDRRVESESVIASLLAKIVREMTHMVLLRNIETNLHAEPYERNSKNQIAFKKIVEQILQECENPKHYFDSSVDKVLAYYFEEQYDGEMAAYFMEFIATLKYCKKHNITFCLDPKSKEYEDLKHYMAGEVFGNNGYINSFSEDEVGVNHLGEISDVISIDIK